jgi:protein gp37
MSENTAIEWATHSFSMWWGCTRIENDPACGPCAEFPDGAVCYAETLSKRFGYSETGSHFPIWGAHEQRRFFGEKHWNEPLEWNAKAAKSGKRARVFCMSMGDWAEGRPDQAEHLERLWRMILITPWLDWLMLTKRPQLIAKLCRLCVRDLWHVPNIWQGTTAVTQKWIDIRWPHLRDVEAEIKWFSIEPMMERIELPQDFLALGPRGWVICGGQSGNKSVQMNADDARYLRDQCSEAGLPFFMKQMSGRTKTELTAIPEDLMIRQYPNYCDSLAHRHV